MFAVDTNVLVAAAVRGAPHHTPALKALEGWRAGAEPWCLTWSIVYEFLRTSTHRALLPHPMTFPQALAFLEGLLASPSLVILRHTDRHLAVLKQVAGEVAVAGGRFVHDVHIAVVLRENGIQEIQSADVDFHRFPFLRVVNPLR
ncbi:MAG: PIN domain-containing protein [Nitrospirae bacterium]|nr:PIN domain-containing protein [Nitrospirota bacterium]